MRWDWRVACRGCFRRCGALPLLVPGPNSAVGFRGRMRCDWWFAGLIIDMCSKDARRTSPIASGALLAFLLR
ncbi:hypothetical protein FB451DRAFT_1300625 [Mycena latifolia]|nr:hypothetical protein FB451DRAFT_1300625 [Mycena latifolia]